MPNYTNVNSKVIYHYIQQCRTAVTATDRGGQNNRARLPKPPHRAVKATTRGSRRNHNQRQKQPHTSGKTTKYGGLSDCMWRLKQPHTVDQAIARRG